MLITTLTIILLVIILIAVLFIAYHIVIRTKFVKEMPFKEKERFKKIMKVAIEFDYITNDIVEEITGVADSTARKDLDSLEKHGFLKQIGKIGRGVHYKPTDAGKKYMESINKPK